MIRPENHKKNTQTIKEINEDIQANREEYEKYLSMTPWSNDKPEEGWETYFKLWNVFNIVMTPFPKLRYHIINTMIPYMMKWRKKQLKKANR